MERQMTSYTHSVIKRQRGMDGRWFDYRGVGYADAETAIAAARNFAERQAAAGVGGTEIYVRARKGGMEIVTFRWDDAPAYTVSMVDWRERARSYGVPHTAE